MNGPLRTIGCTILTVCVSIVSLNACAVYYYDEAEKVEHVWGIGHLKVRNVPSRDDSKATIIGVTTIGASVGVIEGSKQLLLGWSSQRYVSIFENDATIGLAAPDNDLFKLRVGNVPPLDLQSIVGDSE